jgi:G patch domain/KOW motif-containing protein
MNCTDDNNDTENDSQANDGTDRAVNASSTTKVTTADEEVQATHPKQPILQWKTTMKRSRRQRDGNHDSIQDSFQADSTNNDKNNDNNRDRTDRYTEPLIIPVAPNQNKWKQKHEPTTSRSVEDKINNNDGIDDFIAIQALHNDTENDRSLKNGVGNGSTGATIISHANTFVSAGITTTSTLNDREDHQYHKDVEELPSALDETAEEYQRVPVTEFGAAMLRGMGWKDDTADQSAPKNDDVIPHPHRLGLGAIPAMLPPESESSGKGRRPRNIDQYQRDQRTQKQNDTYRIEREKKIAEDLQRTLKDGSIVHLSLRDNDNDSTMPKSAIRARILKLVGVPGLNMVQVQMEHTGSFIVIKRSEINGLVTRQELEQYPFQEKDSTVADHTRQSAISTNPHIYDEKNDIDEKNQHRKEKKRSRKERCDELSTLSWVIPNIRVRIITEKLGRRYYKEKGVVVDVTRNAGVTLRLNKYTRNHNSNSSDSTLFEVLDRVPERYLETALPQIGGNVIIVNAGHTNKYAKGRLIERDGKNKNYGFVQLYDDMDCIRLPLDDIAEWCGPLDDDIIP